MAFGAFKRGDRGGPAETKWAYPVYLVAESGDTAQLRGWRDGLQAALDGLLDELARRPDAADSVLVASVVHRAAMFVERRLGTVADGPAGLERTDTTSYETMFRTLALMIERDGCILAKHGFRFYRPLIVVAFDTPPADSDDWRAAHRNLVVDPDLVDFGQELARAIVVPVCTRPEAEPDCAGMAYPAGIAHAYRVAEPAQLASALRDLLTFAACHLQLIAEGGDMQLLPTGDELPRGSAEIFPFRAVLAPEPVGQLPLPPEAVS